MPRPGSRARPPRRCRRRAGGRRGCQTSRLWGGQHRVRQDLLGDILLHPALRDCEIRLTDIDAERLRVSEIVARRIGQSVPAPATIVATQDLGAALEGADYVFNMIQVGGYRPCTVTDFEVPKRFGLRQTIGDTLGIGGIFRALRTIPVAARSGRTDDAALPAGAALNYANPMAMNCWALQRRFRNCAL